MLTRLIIKNFLVIESAEIEFCNQFNALTGETGTGKSILFEALSLALGKRLSGNPIRTQCDFLEVKAWFEGPFIPDLIEQANDVHQLDIDPDEALLFKRVVEHAKGSDQLRTRCFINDVQIPSNVARQLGEYLIEFQEQRMAQRLLTPTYQLQMLDKDPVIYEIHQRVRQDFAQWKKLSLQLKEEEQKHAKNESERDWLNASLEELEMIAPLEGEDKELSQKRIIFRNARQLSQIGLEIQHYLEGDHQQDGVKNLLIKAARKIDRSETVIQDYFRDLTEGLERIENELNEACLCLDDLLTNRPDEGALEEVEERLHKLRDIARKHAISADDLPSKQAEIATQLEHLENHSNQIEQLKKALSDAQKKYDLSASKLSEIRRKQAKILEQNVCAQLPDLRLDGAKFVIELIKSEDNVPHEDGLERIRFLISTNPGQPLNAIGEVASGGELSRLLLALKVSFSSKNPYISLVFDEIDAAMGGQTAAAVGQCLRKLSQDWQVLAVTHSPQVAASAHHQYKVEKQSNHGQTHSFVYQVKDDQRTDEIARMLSGKRSNASSRQTAFDAAQALEKEMQEI
ncbi:MAG: DNA repair protein RecN [Pseudomonadota bacterium]